MRTVHRHFVTGCSGTVRPTGRTPRFRTQIQLGRHSACRFAGLVWLVFILSLTARLRAQPAAEVLEQIGAILNLPTSLAAEGRPVRIRGVITYYDPEWKLLFVQDSTGGIYVLPEDRDGALEAGLGVELEGATSPGKFSHYIAATRLKPLALSPWPRPASPSPTDLITGKADAQWVSVEGVVNMVEARGSRLTLQISSGGAEFPAYVLMKQAQSVPNLSGASIRLTGVCGVLVDANGSFTGIQLFIPGEEHIIVLQEAEPDPFSQPVQTLSALEQLALSGSLPPFSRIEGRVVALDGRRVTLTNDQRTAEFEMIETSPVALGMWLDAVGRPELVSSRIHLREPRFRRTGVPVTADELAFAATNALPRLTRIDQIRSLNPEAAARYYPVRVRGVVTYLDGNTDMFVQDETAGIYIELENTQLDLRVGQFVEVDGVTSPGSFAPVIIKPQFRILGRAALPPARQHSFREVSFGQMDSQRIELQGIVHSVKRNRSVAVLDVVSEQGHFEAVIALGPNQSLPLEFVDAKLKLKGVCGSVFNQRRQLSGIRLFIADSRHIIVERPSPPDPFSVAAEPVNSLLVFNPGEAAGHRTRVQGVVTHARVGRYFYLQDQSGGVRVFTTEPVELKVGDEADVVGFPAMGDYSPVLRDALVRVRGPGRLPDPLPVPAAALLSADFAAEELDSRRVRVEARLLDRKDTHDEWILVLKAGETLFNASLPKLAGETTSGQAAIGSLLELTGVCNVQVDEDRLPRSFQIQVQSMSDAFVLARPAWWTAGRTLTAVLVLCLVLVVSLGRALMLQKSNAALTERIAERNRAEEATRHEQHLLRTLIDTVPDYIYFKDLESRFTRANEAVARYLKVSDPADLRGRTDFEFFEKEHAERSFAEEKQVMETGLPYTREEKDQWLDGRETWVVTTKMPLRDRNGRVIGCFGIGRDITGRKRAEQELQEAYERLEQRVQQRTAELRRSNSVLEQEFLERCKAEEALRSSEALLQQFVKNAPAAIAMFDLDMRYLQVSRQWVENYNLKGRDVIGCSHYDVFPEITERWKEIHLRCLKGAIERCEEDAFIRADGSIDWLCWEIQPWHTPAGEIGGILMFTQHITERKRTQEELRQAKLNAEAANRAKSEFLANMSHEIRTPMNGIIGMSNLLLDTSLDQEQRDFAETVRSSAEALLSIMNDVLDFSKIEAGRLSFETLDFELETILDGTLNLLAERARAKGIELASAIADDVSTRLRGDPGRLRQVLLNLVANAVKFTETGEVFIRVTLESATETHARLRIEVKDSGIGIPEEVLPRLFQAFQQADNSTTRRFGGTGLGLAISRKLVELMGGEIGVQSKPGSGSTFWFTVTLEKQPVARAAAMTPEAALAGVRVLIVDDNETNRRILHFQVARWKMRDSEATSADEALALLKAAAARGEPCEIVISDMQMPGVDGLTLARQIEADAACGSPRLLMLTSMGQRLDEPELRAAGIALCLVKPVKQAELLRALTAIMRGSEILHELADPTTSPPAPEPAVPRNKGLRILLAEDNAVNQKLAIRQLQKLGYQADVVGTGRGVLEAVRRAAYDLILMDCQMPDLDGYETTRQIRESDWVNSEGRPVRSVRIIAITANAMQGDREKCIEAGMDDYITKPVDFSKLQALLGRWSNV